MKLATWNVNGLRSALKSGLEDFLRTEAPDILGIQEAKISEDLASSFIFKGYDAFWHLAEKPGYSGVGFLVKKGVSYLSIHRGMGEAFFDGEGRVLWLDMGDFFLVNVYAPHAHRELLRLDYKLNFCRTFDGFLASLRAQRKPVLLMGDLNVAHHEVDLTNFKSNRKNAGFLPEERAWLDGWEAAGMQDVFRHFCKDAGHYTWWSQRVGVRERNIGWRIDALWADSILLPRFTGCFHLPLQMGSDHCPVVGELM